MGKQSTITPVSRLVLALVFCTVITVIHTAHADQGDDGNKTTFSLKSLKGHYGFSLEGVTINTLDNTIATAAAIGRFTADGKGNLVNAVRTVNSDGTIQEEIFTGTYTVNANGTGRVTIHASTVLPDGTTIPATTETARFVITRPRNELQFIGTSIRGPAGEDIGVQIVTRGIARKQ